MTHFWPAAQVLLRDSTFPACWHCSCACTSGIHQRSVWLKCTPETESKKEIDNSSIVADYEDRDGSCVTLRKASFCSRCLLIMGVTWSVSQLGPSLSAPPHQSSSRLYSCSRLSNTLHTCSTERRWDISGYDTDTVAWHLHTPLTQSVTPNTSPDLFRGLVEGHGCVDQFKSVFHFQHKLLPVRGHVLGTISDHVHVIMIGLQ